MTYITNPKVGLDYEILDKYEAGIKLSGHEVKSIRAGKGSLQGSYILVGSEAFIKNSFIPAYQENNTPKDYDPYRDRKLILKKSEIVALSSQTKGLTIVPISMYNKGRVIKVELALVRGKKKFDKRATLRKKAVDRDLEREMN